MARLVRIGANITEHGTQSFPLCHGRAWLGHPRLAVLQQGKSWMAGTRPAMTWKQPPPLFNANEAAPVARTKPASTPPLRSPDALHAVRHAGKALRSA